MDEDQPGKGFLTKQRHRRPRTKITLLVIVMVASLIGCFYPPLAGMYVWMFHRQAKYENRSIQLPFLWSQTQDRWGTSWERARESVFEMTGGEVSFGITPHAESDLQLMNTWHRVYGSSKPEDASHYPRLQVLRDAGMDCGSIKFGEQDGRSNGMLALGCLARDHKRTFEYMGPASGLEGAISIMEQAH
jgi:hypothetical protein